MFGRSEDNQDDPVPADPLEPPATPSTPAQSGQPAPGYWQASDGNWYPPQGQAPAPPNLPPQRRKRGGCFKWFGIAIIAIIAIIVIAVVATGGGGDDDTDGDASEEQDLFGTRPDEKEDDKERNIGDSAELSGYTATVTAAAFQQRLSSIERDGYLVADVTLLNRDSDAQSYNTFEWKLITPSGTIVDPYIGGEQLGSGDLAGDGGEVAGQLIWEVGDTSGDFYIVYDPTDLGDDRAVWKFTI